MDTTVKRGEIYYADLSPVVGSEQGGVRPVLIVQNDTGNRHSPTVIAAAITSQMGKAKLPTHIELQAMRYGLPKESVVLLEQVRTLDKQRLRQRMGQVDSDVMEKVDAAIPGWYENILRSCRSEDILCPQYDVVSVSRVTCAAAVLFPRLCRFADTLWEPVC